MTARKRVLLALYIDAFENGGKLSRLGIRLYVENRISRAVLEQVVRKAQADLEVK